MPAWVLASFNCLQRSFFPLLHCCPPDASLLSQQVDHPGHLER